MTKTQILLADELKTSLKLLLEALSLGASVQIHGSPTASVLAATSDLLSIASSQIRRQRKWQLLANPGLKFVEQISLSEEEAENNPYAFLDPLSKDPEKPFYESQFDPLGNPLQVEIAYDNTLPSLSDSARRQIAQCLEDIEVFLSQLSAGLVDWRFMRHLRDFTRQATTKVCKSQKKINQHNSSWRKKLGKGVSSNKR
jgi:hypothetical protein